MRNFRTFVNDPAGNDPAAADYIGATNINNFLGELEAAVTRSGQTITSDDGTDDSDKTQLAKSLFLHSVKAQQFQDNGSANTYQLTPISGSGGVLLPANYAQMDGARAWFVPAFANSGASTINIGQTTGTLLGTRKALNYTGAALTSGALTAGKGVAFVYSAAADTGAGAWLLDPSSVGISPSGTKNLGADIVDDGSGNLTSKKVLTQKTANYSLVAADRNKLFNFFISSSIKTATLLAAGTAGNGYSVEIENLFASTVDLTIAVVSGSGFYSLFTTDASTLTLRPGESATFTSDGSIWLVTGLTRGAASATVLGPVEKATQSETNGGTADKFPSAAEARAAIYACKAWGRLNAGGSALVANYNIASVSLSGANCTVTFSTAMPDANYVVVASGETTAGNVIVVASQTTTSFVIYTRNAGGGVVAPQNAGFAVFGN